MADDLLIARVEAALETADLRVVHAATGEDMTPYALVRWMQANGFLPAEGDEVRGPDEPGERAELEAAEQWARDAMEGTVPGHLAVLLREYDRRVVEMEWVHSALRHETDAHVAERDRLRAGIVRAQTGLRRVEDGLRAALAGSGTAGDTPPLQSVHDAAMRAAVRSRDEWRAAEQGPIEGHPDGPECLAIAAAVLDVVRPRSPQGEEQPDVRDR